MSSYVFKPYHPTFPELFEKEKIRLKVYLTEDCLIEHIGSTAVPGLGGKGIIDIYIAALENRLRIISDRLLDAGYMLREDNEKTKHVTHIIDLPDPIEHSRRYHIHLGAPSTGNFTRIIAFRDYLRRHPEDVKKYAEIKEKAAGVANGDMKAYRNLKGPVIEEITKKALKLLESG